MISQTGLLSLVLLCSVPTWTGLEWNPVLFYAAGSSVIGFTTIPFLWIRLNANPIVWALETILESPERIKLVLVWTACLAVALVVVGGQVLRGQQASTSVRKYFHFLVVAVYTSGKSTAESVCRKNVMH